MMPVVTIVLVKVVGEMLDDDQVVVDAQGKGQGGAQGEGQGPQGGEVSHQGGREVGKDMVGSRIQGQI